MASRKCCLPVSSTLMPCMMHPHQVKMLKAPFLNCLAMLMSCLALASPYELTAH